MKKHLLTSRLWALSLASMLAALGGCTSAEEDICDAKCDCEGCSNAAYDSCIYGHDGDYREADYRGCLDYYDDLVACELDTGFCKGRDWETSCGPEKDRLKNCTK